MQRSLIENMMKTGFYPHGPQSVEFVQTHISMVFIAGDLVFKVKKPVDFGFLDFTTLEKRRHFCEEEVRLNRRLAPDVYLGVAEIREGERGALNLKGEGQIVEYAVVMKRLPQERMLKELLKRGAADIRLMEAVAAKLAAFHVQAATGGEIDEIGGGIDTIRFNHVENFEQTEKYVGLIGAGRYRFLRDYVDDFLKRNKKLLFRRVADHHIRDCHGDLHLEHICILDEIVIFDCIEFNERFRYSDTASEVAFLAMDLDFNGYSDYAQSFVEAYVRHSSDRELVKLLNFYECYRAYVRAKVTSFRLDDAALEEDKRSEAASVAGRYYDLAYTYAVRLEEPALILVCGLMGTGKSVLARGLAGRLGAEVIRMDVLRKKLLGISPAERRLEPFARGIYSEEITEKTYGQALRQAEELLQKGRSVIIDASFKRRDARRKALETAERLKKAFFVVECVLPEDILRQRLEQRAADIAEPSDGRWEIFQAQKKDFDPVTEMVPGIHIKADTSVPPEDTALEVIRRIRLGE